MAEYTIDMSKLPEDVREKLAELDLELSEGKEYLNHYFRSFRITYYVQSVDEYNWSIRNVQLTRNRHSFKSLLNVSAEFSSVHFPKNILQRVDNFIIELHAVIFENSS